MNTFITLLKREYWESKTSFFWVPLIVAGIGIFGTILALSVLTVSDIDAAEFGTHDVGNLFKLYDVSVSDEVSRSVHRRFFIRHFIRFILCWQLSAFSIA